jgi:iron complex outermembrane receptor protein
VRPGVFEMSETAVPLLENDMSARQWGKSGHRLANACACNEFMANVRGYFEGEMSLKYNKRLAYAISVALASAAANSAMGADAAPAAPAEAEQPSSGITEVVVTAQRRSESIQDVPITVQAVTGEQLKALGVQSFNELMKYTPNVTFSGNGPGTGNIFLRGLGGSGSGNQSQSTTAPFPNVGVYLDDQSMQFPARNNDVYLVDMERVEVLEGPQGTLFGGGSQAGAIRYITNKPQFGAVSGETNFGYGITAHGRPNTVLNGTINIPITDNFAIRAVAFSDHRGGYIDNVPATIGYFPGTAPFDFGGNPTANNGPVQGTATNPITYQGARLSALWKINEDWDFLLQQNYQDMHADGYFYTYPTSTDGTALGKYQISAFYPAGNKDRYESTAWTLNGKVGDLLSVVYTGSYMVRHIDGQQDYSNYMRSAVGSLYACIGGQAGYFNSGNFASLAGKGIQCSTPVGGWRDQVDNQHQSHELRVSTNADWRLRGLAGLYWEKFNIDDDMNFNYLGIPQCSADVLAREQAGGPDCLSAVGPVPGAYSSHPGLRTDANTAFGEDVQRGYRQRAAFVSADFDIIPKTLTITGGARFYHYDEYEHGSEYYSESTSSIPNVIQGAVVDHLNGVCTAAGLCGFPISLDKSESGHRLRGNLTWKPTSNIMAYYTYSEGFRPGGFNRTSSVPGGTPSPGKVAPYSAGGKDYQLNKPVGFSSDQLTNHEVGLKTSWFERRLIVNLSGYVMKWSNIQLPLFDPVHLGNTTFDINGPTYRVKGFELQFDARITDELSIQGSSSVNSPEQIDAPCLESNRVTPPGTPLAKQNPTPLGQCITQVNGKPYTNPYGVLGTRPPFSPPWMFNIRARYDFPMFQEYKPFAWIGASHISGQSNEPASFPDGNDPTQANPTTTLLRYQIPGYTTYDAAVGVVRDAWTVQISGQNLSNVYGPTNISSGQFIKSEIPLRPRVVMANVTWKF